MYLHTCRYQLNICTVHSISILFLRLIYFICVDFNQSEIIERQVLRFSNSFISWIWFFWWIPRFLLKIIRNEGKMEWNRHILIKKKRYPSNLFFYHSKEVIHWAADRWSKEFYGNFSSYFVSKKGHTLPILNFTSFLWSMIWNESIKHGINEI